MDSAPASGTNTAVILREGDGGNQERGLANQYRTWAEVASNWPRTRALLRLIAKDWDHQAQRVDTEAKLEQLRDG